MRRPWWWPADRFDWILLAGIFICYLGAVFCFSVGFATAAGAIR